MFDNPISFVDEDGLMGHAPGKGRYPPGFGPGNETSYYGGEGHFFLGGGLTKVTCTDECGKKQSFRYWKVCFGGAIGISGSSGLVGGVNGKSCRQENYAGYFYEAGASFGIFGVGGDVGYTGAFGELPGGTSGVDEGSFGFGWGVSFKSSWCYYFPLGN